MYFVFRRQPFKALCIISGVVYILAALPVWILLDAVPSARPRKSWPLKRALITRLARTIVRLMYQTSLLEPPALAQHERDAKKLGFVWVDAAPELIVGEIKELGEKNGVEPLRTAGFWYGPRDADGNVGQRASAGERVVYHIHGGGHVFGSASPKHEITVLCQGYFEHLGPKLRVFGLEYRISSAPPFEPANPFPASLYDAIAGYRYLIEDVGFEPQNVIFSGDSAGGGIAFNLARYIASAKLPSLPKPGGIILLSPTMDWAQTHVGPGAAMSRNSRSDVVHAIVESGYTARALVGNLPQEMGAKSAWISPGSLQADWKPGMYAGFPRTAIVTGGAEYTLDAMLTVRDRLIQDNGEENVEYIEAPDALHDFLVVTWHEPERTDVLKQLGAWVQSL